jgi:hypothetical protein
MPKLSCHLTSSFILFRICNSEILQAVCMGKCKRPETFGHHLLYKKNSRVICESTTRPCVHVAAAHARAFYLKHVRHCQQRKPCCLRSRVRLQLFLPLPPSPETASRLWLWPNTIRLNGEAAKQVRALWRHCPITKQGRAIY